MNRHGFVRITVCSPHVSVGNPNKNVGEIIAMLHEHADSDIVVFPELCVTGYTCGDLFQQKLLLDETERQIIRLATNNSPAAGQKTLSGQRLVLVGAPVRLGNALYNCAVVINDNKVIGLVPKQNIPTYREFYESRWFRGATGSEPKELTYANASVPFGVDLLFRGTFDYRDDYGKTCGSFETVVGVEICEDLWMPIPPSSHQALNGATVLLNLSASNETVTKSDYRRQLVSNQSGRCVAAYAYASAGPSESTTDLVFGGHCLIAENGSVVSESRRVGQIANVDLSPHHTTCDVDVEKLAAERRQLSSFGEASRQQGRPPRRVEFHSSRFEMKGLQRYVSGTPFVPLRDGHVPFRCAEIFGIQCAGLHKRLDAVGWPDVYIGVSGGLDSTLALLVAAKTFRLKGVPPTKIHGITMPGYGTTAQTKENAVALMRLLGVTQETVDIRALALQTFKDIRHDPFALGIFHPDCDTGKYDVACFEDTLRGMCADPEHPGLKAGDLVFENVQARLRTLCLMSKGFVLGTGDLSELALGWCTYNGDHISMYNVNAGVPKTLVKFLVRYVADTECHPNQRKQGRSIDTTPEADDPRSEELQRTLHAVSDTTISPELLPAGKDDTITQSTEGVLGPYELHDFFLFHVVRNGFSPAKILYLARHAEFRGEFTQELIAKTLGTFLRRFFSQQFKRSCVPDGPKVGSVSLSPRGDWRMPSDADAAVWLGGV